MLEEGCERMQSPSWPGMGLTCVRRFIPGEAKIGRYAVRKTGNPIKRSREETSHYEGGGFDILGRS